MTNNLFPVFNVPSVLAEDVNKVVDKYPPAPLWDVEKGDFILDGAKKTIYGSGYDAWVLWCTKTILTQRWAYKAYGGNIGIEMEEAFVEPDRQAQESAFERTITEALLADQLGRTVQVGDFTFDWNADSLYIGCVVTGSDGNTAAIKATMKN